MYRHKFYGDNPTHQITVGFDDNLRTLFAKVIDLDTGDRLLDLGQQRNEIQSLQLFAEGISMFCQQLKPEIQQRLHQEIQSLSPTAM